MDMNTSSQTISQRDWIKIFLQHEEASRNVIVLKRAYVDMTGNDHCAAILLSQIVYWHMPGKNGESKLRVEKDGELWIAREISEWDEETGLTYKQARRCLEVLEEKKLIIRKNGMFNGKKTNLVRINWEVFIPLYVEACSARKSRFAQEGKTGIALEGKSEMPSRVVSLTEITTETTTQENAAPISARPPADSYVGTPEDSYAGAEHEGLRYVDVGNEFEDEEKGRPKWAIPENHPVLKRMLAVTGREYFHSRNERAMWKVIRQGLQAGTIPQRWIDHCIGFAQRKDRKMKFINLLKYATNFEKMKDFQADGSEEKKPYTPKYEFDPNENIEGPGVYL